LVSNADHTTGYETL